MTIQKNTKGSRFIEVTDKHLETLRHYALLADLLDSHGIVDDAVVEKLRFRARALLEHHSQDADLLSLCQQVLFHDNMKAFGLHELILLYLAKFEEVKNDL